LQWTTVAADVVARSADEYILAVSEWAASATTALDAAIPPAGGESGTAHV
jgi:hypothetical protein